MSDSASHAKTGSEEVAATQSTEVHISSTDETVTSSTTESQPWCFDNIYHGEEKNPFSCLSEEHLSQLDQVLSCEEVRKILQTTDFHGGSSSSQYQPVTSSMSSSQATNNKPESKTFSKDTELFNSSDDSIKLEVFDDSQTLNQINVTSEVNSLDLDTEDTDAYILKEEFRELASVAVTVSDHAYAIPADREPKTVSPLMSNKSAQTPFDMPEKEYETDAADVKKNGVKESAATTDGTPLQPLRRSTRISEHEQREKAEKIRQENRQKERKAIEEMKAQQQNQSEPSPLQQPQQQQPVSDTELKEDLPIIIGRGRGRGQRGRGRGSRGRGRGRGIGAKRKRDDLLRVGSDVEDLGSQSSDISSTAVKTNKENMKLDSCEIPKDESGGDKEEELEKYQQKEKIIEGKLERPKRQARLKKEQRERERKEEEMDRKKTRRKKKVSLSEEEDLPLLQLKKKQETVEEKVISPDEDNLPLHLLKKENKKKQAEQLSVSAEKPKLEKTDVKKRRKSRKSEEGIDLTVTELFKPDAVIIHEIPKKEEIKATDPSAATKHPGEKSAGTIVFAEDKTFVEDKGCQADVDSDYEYESCVEDQELAEEKSEDQGKDCSICRMPVNSQSQVRCDVCIACFHGHCAELTLEEMMKIKEDGEKFVCDICFSGDLSLPSQVWEGRSLQQKLVVKSEAIGGDRKINPLEILDVEGLLKKETEKEKTKEQLKKPEAKSPITSADINLVPKKDEVVKKPTEEGKKPYKIPKYQENKDSIHRDSTQISAVERERSEFKESLKQERWHSKDKDQKETVKERKEMKYMRKDSKELKDGSRTAGQDRKDQTDRRNSKDREKDKKIKENLQEQRQRRQSTDIKRPDISSAQVSSSTGNVDVIPEKKGEQQHKRKNSEETEVKKKKFVDFKDLKKKRTFQQCIGAGCQKDARTGSVYCSDDCIVRHAQESLHLLKNERQIRSGNKTETSNESSKVVVLERKTGRILTGPTAPTESVLREWLTAHPTFEVLQPSSYKTPSFYSSGSKDRDRRDRHVDHKIADSTGKKDDSSSEKEPHDGPDPIRLNVRKSLRDALAYRARDADDIMLSNSEIKQLAVSIEDELFKYFHDSSNKYKAKYRSLVFNIRDAKNKGLFRKILTRRIKPSKLVRMTPEELASKELAKWRQMETKHALEMIEMRESEALKDAGKVHVVKKTHKGEMEVDEEDLSTLETVGLSSSKEEKPKTDPKADLLAGLVTDSTDQHRTHLFDLNCKICTGKMAPPHDELPAKKITVSKTVEPAKEPTETADKKKTETEDMMKEVLRVIKKVKGESPSLDAGPATVTVRSPDSALQSGLEVKPKFTPLSPVIWKGFIHMQDLVKFMTTAYRMSGPTESLEMQDTIHVCGRIAPELIWDYLSRIKQSGSRDICVLRFLPGADDEKNAYVQLYSYLNSRGRCGVVGNNSKHIKDMYIVPLASHSKIPAVLTPLYEPGKKALEDNRPHMLLGVIVKQKSLKRPIDSGTHTQQAQPSEDSLDPKRVKYDPTQPSMQPMVQKQSNVKELNKDKFYTPTPSLPDKEKYYNPLTADKEAKNVDPSLSHAESSTSNSPEDLVQHSTDPIIKVYGKVSSASDASNSTPVQEDTGQAAYTPTQYDSPADLAGEDDDASENGGVEDKPYDPEDDNFEKSKVEPKEKEKEDQKAQSSSSNVGHLIDQIVKSNNPNEMTATMITALAASSNLADQRRLLLELTQKVEEQKKKIAQQKQENEKTSSSGALPSALQNLFTHLSGKQTLMGTSGCSFLSPSAPRPGQSTTQSSSLLTPVPSVSVPNWTALAQAVSVISSSSPATATVSHLDQSNSKKMKHQLTKQPKNQAVAESSQQNLHSAGKRNSQNAFKEPTEEELPKIPGLGMDEEENFTAFSIFQATTNDTVSTDHQKEKNLGKCWFDSNDEKKGATNNDKRKDTNVSLSVESSRNRSWSEKDIRTSSKSKDRLEQTFGSDSRTKDRTNKNERTQSTEFKSKDRSHTSDSKSKERYERTDRVHSSDSKSKDRSSRSDRLHSTDSKSKDRSERNERPHSFDSKFKDRSDRSERSHSTNSKSKDRTDKNERKHTMDSKSKERSSKNERTYSSDSKGRSEKQNKENPEKHIHLEGDNQLGKYDREQKQDLSSKPKSDSTDSSNTFGDVDERKQVFPANYKAASSIHSFTPLSADLQQNSSTIKVDKGKNEGADFKSSETSMAFGGLDQDMRKKFQNEPSSLSPQNPVPSAEFPRDVDHRKFTTRLPEPQGNLKDASTKERSASLDPTQNIWGRQDVDYREQIQTSVVDLDLRKISSQKNINTVQDCHVPQINEQFRNSTYLIGGSQHDHLAEQTAQQQRQEIQGTFSLNKVPQILHNITQQILWDKSKSEGMQAVENSKLYLQGTGDSQSASVSLQPSSTPVVSLASDGSSSEMAPFQSLEKSLIYLGQDSKEKKDLFTSCHQDANKKKQEHMELKAATINESNDSQQPTIVFPNLGQQFGSSDVDDRQKIFQSSYSSQMLSTVQLESKNSALEERERVQASTELRTPLLPLPSTAVHQSVSIQGTHIASHTQLSRKTDHSSVPTDHIPQSTLHHAEPIAEELPEVHGMPIDSHISNFSSETSQWEDSSSHFVGQQPSFQECTEGHWNKYYDQNTAYSPSSQTWSPSAPAHFNFTNEQCVEIQSEGNTDVHQRPLSLLDLKLSPHSSRRERFRGEHPRISGQFRGPPRGTAIWRSRGPRLFGPRPMRHRGQIPNWGNRFPRPRGRYN